MNLAAVNVPLPGGEPDQVGILRFLERVKTLRQREPFVREIAVSLLCGIRDNDQTAQAHVLLNFVQSRMQYVRDPVGSEYVKDPVEILAAIQQGQRVPGDCDDHALLLATLLGAVGIETKLAGVKLHGGDWNHVIVRARLGAQWRDLDPCAKRSAPPVYAEHLTLSEPTTPTNPRSMSPYASAVNGYALNINWGAVVNGVNMLGQTATGIIGAINSGKGGSANPFVSQAGQPQPIILPQQQKKSFMDEHGMTLALVGIGVVALIALKRR